MRDLHRLAPRQVVQEPAGVVLLVDGGEARALGVAGRVDPPALFEDLPRLRPHLGRHHAGHFLGVTSGETRGDDERRTLLDEVLQRQPSPRVHVDLPEHHVASAAVVDLQRGEEDLVEGALRVRDVVVGLHAVDGLSPHLVIVEEDGGVGGLVLVVDDVRGALHAEAAAVLAEGGEHRVGEHEAGGAAEHLPPGV